MELESDSRFNQVILQAFRAFKAADHSEAYRLSQAAIQLDPNREAPWLILAAIGTPEESIQFLKRALEINPYSERARKGMHWAAERLRKQRRNAIPAVQPMLGDTGSLVLPRPRPASDTQPVKIKPLSSTTSPLISDHWAKWLTWGGLAIASILVFIAILLFVNNQIVSARSVSISRPPDVLLKPSLTPTITSSPTATFTNTPTITPTETPTLKPTKTAKPTKKPKPTREPPDTPTPETQVYYSDDSDDSQDYSDPGPASNNSGRWIDVDLTNQRVYAYQDNELQNSFVVSTGTWQHPTVTGNFRIYVMYKYADMRGPGYYLADVPYVMYFYQGYGLHGTYWHNNFGTPMSHGCVNLSISDAAWLYNWASVGTPVNVHY